MANQVTKSNLFSESRNNVVALITATNVADPISVSTEFRKRIYSRDPDTKSIDFGKYPYIIVHPAEVDIEKEKGQASVDGKSKFVYWTIEVELVASDRGGGNKDGKGLSHIDAMSDDIAETFNSKTNRKTLSTNSMKFASFDTTTVTTEVQTDTRIYRRSIVLNFESRIQVSS